MKPTKFQPEVDKLPKQILTVFILSLLAVLGVHSAALAALQIGVGGQLQNEQSSSIINMNWWLTDNLAIRGDYSGNTEALGAAALYKINPGSGTELYFGLAENDLSGKIAPEASPEQKTALIAGLEWDLSRIKPGLSLMTEAGINPNDFNNESEVDNGLASRFSITLNYRFPPANPETSNNKNNAGLLARLIMLEASDEPFEGQVAVAAVVLNRTRNSNFPDSVQEVIYQPGQFSTARRIAKTMPDESALKAAKEALRGSDPSNGALYFYNPATASRRARRYIKNANFQVTARIGHHIFYK